MNRVLLVSLLVLGLPAVAFAGTNPDTRVCMHLIATDQYLVDLYTTDLAELTLADIDQDLTVAELSATGYYAYCILCAYNIDNISGIEFQIDGWPTGRGAPVAPTLDYEDVTDTQVLAASGFPFGAGGVVTGGLTWGGCDGTGANVRQREWWGDDNNSPGNCKIYPFASFWINLSTATVTYPINLAWVNSTYSYAGDPHNYVMDCTLAYVEDTVAISDSYGCTIGGDYTTPIVNSVEPATWSTIKALYRSSYSAK